MDHALINMAMPEVKDQLERNPVVVIPAGSVEQHGAHLPFGTDYFAAHLFAERLAQEIDALLVPFTPLGVTPVHMSFPGTISLSPETFMGLLGDVCESMIRHGAQRIVVVNWHELNEPLIALVASKIQQKHPVRFVLVQAHYVALDLYGQDAGLTHGGLLEALPVLAHDPSLVRLDRATDPSPRDKGSAMDKLRRRREAYTVVHDVREMYPTGWYGTLEGATVARAQEFVEGVTSRIVEYVNEALATLTAVTDEGST